MDSGNKESEIRLMDTIKINYDDGICVEVKQHLHRYSAINEKLEQSLVENYLWFSDPMGFNDPYDCNLEVYCDGTFEEILNYLYEANVVADEKVPNQYLLDRAGLLAARPDEMEKLSKKADMDTISKLGVCCLSERKDSLLMWSHYGDSYRGICLTFDISRDWELFSKHPLKVEYPENYPLHRFPAEHKKFHSYRFLVATKSREWAYENEVRLVRDDHSAPFREKVPFNKNALIGVTFGHKCPEESRRNIIRLLRQVGGYEHVNFYITKLKRYAFGVEFYPLLD